MSTEKKATDRSPSTNLDPDDKVLRRRREDSSEEPREQKKRIKLEIVDDPNGPKAGYDPYDAS